MEGVLDSLVRELLTEVNDYDLCITEFLRVVDQLLPVNRSTGYARNCITRAARRPAPRARPAAGTISRVAGGKCRPRGGSGFMGVDLTAAVRRSW